MQVEYNADCFGGAWFWLSSLKGKEKDVLYNIVTQRQFLLTFPFLQKGNVAKWRSRE